MFQGFSDATFEFFMAIRFNNNREFFHDNHEWYMEAVRRPGLELAKALSPAIEALDETLERRPDRVLSRINRDTRFSYDKSPYRDYIWLGFRGGDDPENNKPAPYFELGADGAAYGCGMYYPNRPMMNGFRRLLDADPGEFAEIWGALAGDFTLHRNPIKRMAVPDSLPDIVKPWYNLRGFYIEKEIRDFALLKSAALADGISEGLARITPLYRYFQRAPLVESD